MASDRQVLFRRNLRRLMEAKGLTPRQLAIESGVTLKWVKRAFEQGLDRLYERNRSQLAKIAVLLGISGPSDFWREDCESEANPFVVQLQELLQSVAGGPFEAAMHLKLKEHLDWLSSQVEYAKKKTGFIAHELESQFPREWVALLDEFRRDEGDGNFLEYLAIQIINTNADEVREAVLGKLNYISSELEPEASRHRVTKDASEAVLAQGVYAAVTNDDSTLRAGIGEVPQEASSPEVEANGRSESPGVGFASYGRDDDDFPQAEPSSASPGERDESVGNERDDDLPHLIDDSQGLEKSPQELERMRRDAEEADRVRKKLRQHSQDNDLSSMTGLEFGSKPTKANVAKAVKQIESQMNQLGDLAEFIDREVRELDPDIDLYPAPDNTEGNKRLEAVRKKAEKAVSLRIANIIRSGWDASYQYGSPMDLSEIIDAMRSGRSSSDDDDDR